MGLLQQIATVAWRFSRSKAGRFSPDFDELKQLVSQVTLMDCNYDAQHCLLPISGRHEIDEPAPCLYTPIYEDDSLHMSIFACRSEPHGYIPLHDHKGMHGFLKVLYGKARIQTFTKTDKVKLPANVPPRRLFKQRLASWQENSIFAALAGASALTLDHTSECSILTPTENNLHFIQPVKNYDVAFFDLLIPPYCPSVRDCSYFTVLEPCQEHMDEQGQGDRPSPIGVPTTHEDQDVVWLARCPPPTDYFCEEIPFNGQKIDLQEMCAN